MSAFDDILSGIYGSMETSIIVYSTEGSVIWQNRCADRILSDNNKATAIIFSEIVRNQYGSGKITYAHGGRFHVAEIAGRECYIAELYPNNRLLSLFGESSVVRFAQYSDMTVRHAITGISASCEILAVLTEKTGGDEAKLCLNNIITSCCRLMQSVSLNSQLTAVADEKDLNPEPINVDMFFEEFAQESSRALGKNANISYVSCSGCIICVDRALLTYFLLGLVRRLIGYGNEIVTLEISAEVNESKVEIAIEKLNADKPDDTGKGSLAENLKNIDDEISGFFAERLKATYSLSGNTLNISFNRAENNGEATLRSDKTFLSDSLFSPYNIMLNDLMDFRSFY